MRNMNEVTVEVLKAIRESTREVFNPSSVSCIERPAKAAAGLLCRPGTDLAGKIKATSVNSQEQPGSVVA